MTRDELKQLIADVQYHQSELVSVEVKAARGGTPRRLYEPLSAFANRTGGGVLLFGLNESSDFAVVGVADVHRLQEEITHLASSEMEPILRPHFLVDEVDGETVMVAEIDEVPIVQKPCLYKPAGLPRGAYLRVGNTNRQMTEYEVFGYLSSRGQPTFDEEVIPDATIEGLDSILLNEYLARLRQARPTAGFLDGPREEVLARLHVLVQDGETMRPSLAGLLMFGKYPQEFLPQLMITFVQYYGTMEDETPAGARFVDSRSFEGPIPEMLDDAERYVMTAMRKSSLIEGLLRRDIPEYPVEALREALANAVAHRDYSTHVRELHSDSDVRRPPGDSQSRRPARQRDAGKHRGGALDAQRPVDADHGRPETGREPRQRHQGHGPPLRDANLEPPRFDDRRSSFLVVFRNHTLMNPEAVRWLNQFADDAAQRPAAAGPGIPATARVHHQRRLPPFEPRRCHGCRPRATRPGAGWSNRSARCQSWDFLHTAAPT